MRCHKRCQTRAGERRQQLHEVCAPVSRKNTSLHLEAAVVYRTPDATTERGTGARRRPPAAACGLALAATGPRAAPPQRNAPARHAACRWSRGQPIPWPGQPSANPTLVPGPNVPHLRLCTASNPPGNLSPHLSVSFPTPAPSAIGIATPPNLRRPIRPHGRGSSVRWRLDSPPAAGPPLPPAPP